jgi:hypothetical protein
MFKDFELFSSQYTEFIDSGKKLLSQDFVVIHKISKTANFTRNYLKNSNDSEDAIKTKNVPFFMNFLNIHKKTTFFIPDWSFKALNGMYKKITSLRSF